MQFRCAVAVLTGLFATLCAVQVPHHAVDHSPTVRILNNRDLTLSWTIDWLNEEVTFTVNNALLPKRRYFMFGFSYWENAHNSDYCLFDRDDPDKIIDGSVGPTGKMRVDAQQDWTLLARNGTTIVFKRKFDTCDPYDTVITESTMHIVWIRSNRPRVKLVPSEKHNHDEKHKIVKRMGTMTMTVVRAHNGITPLQILRIKTRVPEKNIIQVPVLADKHKVGPGNFYLCKVVRLDQLVRTKLHMVEWQPVLDNPNLHHHIALYHCDHDPKTTFEEYDGDCISNQDVLNACQRAIAIWGIGSPGFTYPPEAGLPIGGPDSNPYYRLELHYVNMENKTDIVDSSGFMLHVIEKLRKHDAGHMELGMPFEDRSAVPPGHVAFPFSSKCDASCTAASLPREGITIFAAAVHAHSHGKRMTMHHVRHAQILGTVFKEDYFSERVQNMVLLRNEVKVLPGDELYSKCFYDTVNERGPIVGGLLSTTEMCLHYIAYYPAVNMVRCKSSISKKSLKRFFTSMKSHFPLIDTDDTATNNYDRIDWSRADTVDRLYDAYVHEPIDTECTMLNNARVPGEWEDMAPLKISPFANLTHWRVMDGDACSPKGVTPLERGKCGYSGECVY